MANVFDVAKYILQKQGEMTAMKLQKLAYYVKAWGLVWDEEEIFPEDFQAWANGAICYELYKAHKGRLKVSKDLFDDGDVSNISIDFKETIDVVLETYGKYTAFQLSDLNHQESPWIEARGNLEPDDRCTKKITSAAMHEYYSGLSKQ